MNQFEIKSLVDQAYKNAELNKEEMASICDLISMT